MTLTLAASALSGSGCSVLQCGAGTAPVDGVCQIVAPDASNDTAIDAGPSAPDASQSTIESGAPDHRTDAGSPGADGAIPEVTEIRLVVFGPSVSRNAGDPVIPVGGIVEFTVRGLNTAREWVTIPPTLLSAEGEAVIGRLRDPLDEAPARFSVVGIRAGTALVRASVETPRGTRTAELVVTVDEPVAPVALACVTHQDQPGVFSIMDGLVTDAVAELPTDLSARALCTLTWIVRTATGDRAVRHPLADADYTVVVASGPGRVEERSLVAGLDRGDVELTVTYAPEGTLIRAPIATAHVRFIADLPAFSIGLRSGRDWEIAGIPAGTEPEMPVWAIGQDNVHFVPPDGALQLVVVTWHRIDEVSRYHRVVPFGDVAARWVAGPRVADLDASGRVTWLAPGIGGLFLTARGLVKPMLIATQFRASTMMSLRAAVDSIRLAPPPRGVACVTVPILLTVDGVERPLSALEARALRRDSETHTFLFDGSRDPDRYCASTAERTLPLTPTTVGTLSIFWIPPVLAAHRAVPLPFTIVWPSAG